MMRTTLSIDDDILNTAKVLAEAQERTVGDVVSDLARKGLEQQTAIKRKTASGIPTFKVKRGSRRITPEDVKQAEDEL